MSLNLNSLIKRIALIISSNHLIVRFYFWSSFSMNEIYIKRLKHEKSRESERERNLVIYDTCKLEKQANSSSSPNASIGQIKFRTSPSDAHISKLLWPLSLILAFSAKLLTKNVSQALIYESLVELFCRLHLNDFFVSRFSRCFLLAARCVLWSESFAIHYPRGQLMKMI